MDRECIFPQIFCLHICGAVNFECHRCFELRTSSGMCPEHPRCDGRVETINLPAPAGVAGEKEQEEASSGENTSHERG